MDEFNDMPAAALAAMDNGMEKAAFDGGPWFTTT